MTQAFAQLNIKTVRCLTYDVNEYVFPDSIDYTMGVPLIYLFPAYSKQPPFIRYNGEGHAGTFLKWVEKHAENKFTFPVDVSRVGSPKTEEEIARDKARAEQLEKQK